MAVLVRQIQSYLLRLCLPVLNLNMYLFAGLRLFPVTPSTPTISATLNFLQTFSNTKQIELEIRPKRRTLKVELIVGDR